MRSTILRAFLTLALLVAGRGAQAQGTAFTYQGQLLSGSAPASGSYDMEFTLFAGASGGLPLAGPITNFATAVNNGLFTVTLDFGIAFNGAPRWLELAVRTNGSGAFTVLSPRQDLLPAPYAIFANSASNLVGTLPAAQLSGYIPAANLAGSYNSAVSFNNGADVFDGTFFGQFFGSTFTGGTFTGQFIGDGNGLADLNASQLTSGTVPLGHLPSNIALLNTNQTFTGTNVFATGIGIGNPNPVFAIDAMAGQAVARFVTTNNYYGSVVELHNLNTNGSYYYLGAVNFDDAYGNTPGQIAYVVVNPTNAYNDYLTFHVGYSYGALSIQSDPRGAGVANIIGGSWWNSVSTLGSGGDVIGGGGYPGGGNTILSNSSGVFIGAGSYNTVGPNCNDAVIAGGIGQAIQSGDSVISGGYLNLISTNSGYSVIGGGAQNTNAGYISTIGGGYLNTIAPGSWSTIAGGYYNHVLSNANLATIAGGYGHSVSMAGGVVSGGGVLYIATNGTYIFPNQANGYSAVVPGGVGNYASGDFSFAAGHYARALHNGSFVWADSQNATISTTTNDQFLVRAEGGVKFFTSGGGMFLDGLPVIAGSVGSGQLSGEYVNPISFSNPGDFFAGDGSGLTDLNASQLLFGTVPSGVLSGTYGNSLNFSNTLNTFVGNGSGLTSLNASQLTSGVLPSAVVVGTYANPLVLTNPANVYAGNGISLANVNAAFLGGLTPGAYALATNSPTYSGTVTAGSLVVSNDARVSGLLHSGLGIVGEAPSPDGLIVRRLNTVNTTSNLVVAVCKSYNNTTNFALVRDGSNGGFQITYPTNGTFFTIACMGIDSAGNQRNFYTNMGITSLAGTIQIYSNAQNIVHFECTFGTTYLSAQHLTQVTLSRWGPDSFWSGNLTSTSNQ